MKTKRYFDISLSLLITFLLSMLLLPTFAAASEDTLAVEPNNGIAITLQIGNPNMTVNGLTQAIDATNTAPVLVNNRSLAPIRAIAEAMGAEVLWDNNQQKVTIMLGKRSVEMWINNSDYKVSGTATTMDVPPKLIKSRTFMPLRAIAEALGCTISWDDQTKSIHILDQETTTFGKTVLETTISGTSVPAPISSGGSSTGSTPGTTTPDTITPDTITPDTITPDTITPDTITPDTTTPDTITSDTITPDTITPDTNTPGVGVVYSTLTNTNQTVVATIYSDFPLSVINNNGLNTYTFTANGSFVFDYVYGNGNTGSKVASVSNIDKTPPVITIGQYLTTNTYQNITVTASTNEGSLNVENYLFSNNGSFDFTATDASGNTSTKTVTISNIVQYLIELDRWGIDGTPSNNSNGINNALVWAYQNGYSEVIFPQGEYLIKEDLPINIVNFNNMKINLNNATLRINTNGLLATKIINIADCNNVQLVNGTILGDINTHDYTTNPGPHEKNFGINIDGGTVNCTLEGLTVKDITGWGINTSLGKDYTGTPIGIVKTNLRQGSIDTANGTKINDSTKISTITPIDITRCMDFADKYFILAYDKGYMGNPFLTTNKFDVIFYDKDQNIISNKSNQLLYKKVFIPDNVVYADFVFYQQAVPTRGDADFNDAVLFVTHHIQPTNIKITNCTIDGSRSLGMAICGGDSMTIENNLIKNTKGQAPGYAVNLEDGWEFMNNIKFINNTFENNINDFVSCAGDNMVIEGNRFTQRVYIYSRSTNYIVRNNTFNGSNITFQDNMTMNHYTTSGNQFVNSIVSGANLHNSSFVNSDLFNTLSKTYNCTFSSTKKVALNGDVRDSSLNNLWAEGNFNLYNCNVNNSNLLLSGSLVNGQITKKNIIDNCDFNTSRLNPDCNIDLSVTNSRMTDTTMGIGGGWNLNLFITLESNLINNSNVTTPFINALNSFGRITLKNNNLSITSTQPIIKLTNPAASNGQPLVAAVNIIGNSCTTSDGLVGDVLTLTFGLPTSKITVTDLSNTFNNIKVSDEVKNKSMIIYTTGI